MGEEKIEVDFSPEKVLAATKDIGEKVNELARIIEDSLGRKAPKSIQVLEDAAEGGSGRIATFFSNLGKRIKEDLGNAFDVTKLMAGANFAEEIGKGVKSVFDLEAAFARLNTRLKLSASDFASFKTAVGRGVSSTGAKTEEIIPGIEAAASKGGITAPKELADIGKILGQQKIISGEDSETLADSIIETMRNQQKAMTAKNFKDVADALQSARTSGAFKTASEAGSAVEDITKITRTKYSTREAAAMAAQASKAGEGGMDILTKLLEKGQTVEGRAEVNALLGQKVFGKGGKADLSAIGKVDLSRFGPNIGEEQTAALAGFEGASGADFVRFVETMRKGDKEFRAVLNGQNETATQFGIASDNLKNKVDRFRRNTEEAGREIGNSLSSAANELLKGNFKEGYERLKDTGKSVKDNAGTIGASLGITAGVGMLAGGGLSNILKKLPGGGLIGKTMGSMIGGAAAEQAGVQKVFVVNASEIGTGLGGGAAGALGTIGKIGLVGAAATGGVMAGKALGESETGNKIFDAIGGSKIADMLFNAFTGVGSTKRDVDEQRQFREQKQASRENTDEIAKAVERGASKAQLKIEHKTNFTNPSSLTGLRGG